MAIGSMAPDIELWDLDVLESLEPAFVLAGDVGKSSKKKKKKRKSVVKGHSDAVLDLSWNKNQRQALASASADFTLGLWDLEQGEMVTSFPHEEKVYKCKKWLYQNICCGIPYVYYISTSHILSSHKS